MFAALLRRAGANAQLLPLLSEPASAAVRGLSIAARRARPAATVAFLQVAVPGCLKHQCCSCWVDSCGNEILHRMPTCRHHCSLACCSQDLHHA